ncbi:pro-resilin-like [Amyelois transitella]|uniref:pro-resilin-like n=1 Tax=Amyelois transitella TaxID=680683 RepID=UPI0029904565|nr:pro-resilin-like [Amyelois transitella]
MVHFKLFSVTLLAALANCEPPVTGYNYQPNRNYQGYQPSNNYLPPTTGYSPPTNNYLPPSSFGSQGGSFGPNHGGSFGSNHGFGSGDQGSYDHGQSHGGHGHDNEEPKSYEFGYSVKDAQSGNDYDRRESSDGNVVRGEYRVQLPDGRTQIVTYHADWRTGFHADVRYEGEARYPEPSQQGGYNYNAPADFSGSLTGFGNGYKQPSTQYGPPGYH